MLTRTFLVLVLSCFGFLSKMALSAELSGGLSRADLKQHSSILSMGSLHRAWTAHAKESGPLGLNLGVESVFIFRRDLLSTGDGLGIFPKTIPVPRFWLGWDLEEDFKMSTSFAPGALFDGISTFGLGGQWLFDQDVERASSSSLLVHYTFSDAFGDLRAHTFGAAAQITRDLEVWQPYAGAGFLFNAAEVDAALMASGLSSKEKRLAMHVYFGARLDLAAKLAIQVDLADLKPSVAILLSNSF